MFLFCLLFGIASCNKNVVYSDYVNIPKEGWLSTSLVYFDVAIQDTLAFTSMSLNVTNTNTYSFSNIYFFITVMFPDGRMSRDTVGYDLADQYGKWIGKGIGNEKTVSIPYRSNMLFPRTGIYRFYVEQGMRENPLTGITSIGIELKKEKN